MLKPVFTTIFDKDIKKAKRRNWDIDKLKEVIRKIINEEPLEVRHRDHSLIGNYKGRRECHIEPDWLLIYKPSNEEVIFERTGTHSDLFR